MNRSFIIISTLLFVFCACEKDINQNNQHSHTDSVKVNERRLAPQQMAKVDADGLQKVKDLLKDNYKIDEGDKSIVALDQSQRSRSEKITFTKKDKSAHFDLNLYEYGAKREFKRAYKLFLKGLGDLANVKEGENMKAIKSPPMMAIVNNGNIVLLRYSCEEKNANDWDSIRQTIKEHLADSGAKIIHIACGGPLNWEYVK